MADESSKTRRLWGDLEASVLRGEGIDIGCGTDPVFPDVTQFDVAQGDANQVSRHVDRLFDFVYASHCLEHMVDPRLAIEEWWRLVKPGGVLFFIVPDEDLYEQGFWPSRFNADHKWTFTISKQASWSPVSINLFDLVRTLPGSEIVDIRLQDAGYQRHLLSSGYRVGSAMYRIKKAAGRVAYVLLRGLGLDRRLLKRQLIHPTDQTCEPDVLAQIQCIVRKVKAG
jgi:SAM-dependent methyltransferase